MASHQAIYSVGASLVAYLRDAYSTDAGRISEQHPCSFALLSSGEMNDPPNDGSARLSLYLYRVTMNEHLRNSARAAGPSDAPPPLAVDLHYLLTVWAGSAEAEQVILGWAMRKLHYHETLSASDLSPEGGWGEGDLVQIIPAELANEDLMRIWDALAPPYHLSVSYIARVVRIDPEVAGEGARPVIARRFVVSGAVPSGAER
jgi:hypothetical protein